MHDLPQIDERLSDALRRYADSAVLPHDAFAITRDAYSSAAKARPDWRQGRALVMAVGMCLLLALALAAWAVVGQQLGPPTFPLGSIAFTRGGDLYVAGPDGQGARLLASVDTTKGDGIGFFSFAPDRRSLAYEIQNDAGTIDKTEIVDVDGRPVGTFPDLMKHSSWAPDGQSLAVFSFEGVLSVRGLDGTNLRVLPLPDVAYDLSGSRRVAWSPDGRWIAVSACRDLPTSSSCKFDHDWSLVALDASGSHWLGEPTGPSDAELLAWSGDSRIALAGRLGPTGPTGGVQVFSPDTGLLREIDVPSWTEDQAWWTPDSSRLLVEGHRSDDAAVAGLAVVDAAGTSTVLATDPVAMDGPAGWSDDGQRVLFTGSVDGSHGVWSIDAAGGGPKLLIEDVDPSWFAVASFPLGRFPQ
jgi:hypothetical protein